jgi:hypothetical protein
MSIAGRRTGPTLLLVSLLAVLGCSGRPLPAGGGAGGEGSSVGGLGSPLGHAGGGSGDAVVGSGGLSGAGGVLAGVGGAGGVAGLAAGGDTRPADKGSGTGGTGVTDCNGRARGTMCGAGTCKNSGGVSVITGRYACDGRGNCNPTDDVLCGPFACDAKTGACLTACVRDTDCTNGKPCLNGSCEPKALGATCLAGVECESGLCADGVCCNATCAGACVSCAVAGHVGMCWPTPAGAADPHGTCAVTSPASCGRDGTCDGVGGCANYAVGTVCGATACREHTYTTTARCNGVGTCVRTSVDCAPFVCDGPTGQCLTSCATDQDCAGQVCVNGSCGVKEQACAADGECPSGFCSQGVCCQSRCNGACQSCAQPGSIGICRVISAADGGQPCGGGQP